MNKRTYFIASIIFLVFLSCNILNDKYFMDYQLSALTINNPANSSGSEATIYGDETNKGIFVETPKVDLPKGDYLIKIQYRADTDLNFISLKGKTKSQELVIEEAEKYLSASEQERVIHVNLKEDVHNFKVSVNFCGKGTLVFENIAIESDKVTNTDTLVWMLIFSILFLVIGRLAFYQPCKENRIKLLVLFCLLGITVIASYPMFLDYIIKGHDSAFHFTRMEGIKSGLLSGQFPVRLHTSTLYDYGYASSIFYPELFLYIPAFLRVIGVTMTGTVQIFIIFINFATAGIMYFSAYRISKVRGIAILSSILYVLASYHLCDIYTRFAIGEVLAMAFLPLMIYGVYELLYNDYTKWKYAVLGATGVLQSHIISTLITAALVGLAVILCAKKLADKKRFYACLKVAFITVLMNLWFLIPLVSMMREEMNVTSLGRNVEELTLYVTQLFQNFTVNGEGRNIIGTNLEGVMPLHIGFPIVLGVMFFIYTMIYKKYKDENQEKRLLTLLGFGALCAWATTNLFPWKIIVSIPLVGKMARMIQFPWRFLAFAVAFLSIVAAYGIYYLVSKSESRRIIVVVVFALSVVFASHYLDNFMEKDIYCYKGAVKVNTGIGTGEYYYKGTNTDELIDRGEKIDTSSAEITVSQFERKRKTFDIAIVNYSNEDQYVEIPLAYYPFYSGNLNGEELKIEKGSNNVIRIIVPAKASGTLQVKYKWNLSWRIADLISVITIIVFLLGSFQRVRKKYQKVIFLCTKKQI